MENDAAKLGTEVNTEFGTETIIQDRPRCRARRLVLGLLAALAIGMTVMATVAQPLWAAIELAYYRGASTNNAVFLEWATVREVNINGFEILCKRINDPDAVYHPIGSRIALGSATSGATYNFDVTSGLLPGERYCFRLREITSDQTPGEAFDLCGYGLGLIPLPTTVPLTVDVSIPVTLTPTIVAVTPVPGLGAAPTLAPPTPTFDPFATPIPTIAPLATITPTVDPFAVPTATFDPFATPTATPTQPVSVLATPTITFTPTFTPTQQASVPVDGSLVSQDQDSSAAQVPITGTPVEEPTATLTATVVETPTDIPTPTATLTTSVPITLTPSIPAEGGVPVAVDPNAAPSIPDSVVAVEATPTPIYMVVTATPTPLAAAVVVAPTFTPWPTAAPTVAFAMSNLLVPNTQNLMVGLLCLIFVSASGLGALGLVTSVLYMRSQTRRDRLVGDRLPGPVYERRRY